MGNNEAKSQQAEDSAIDIIHKKTEVEFKQVDFIKEIEESIQTQYELLSPCIEQNQFYQLRKVIHLKTRLTRAVYIVNKYKIRSRERELFEQQIHKLKMVDHPAIPKIYELFKNDNRFFVVVQYKYGESLANVLQRQHYFEERAAASILWQLLSILSHCHKRGITHTDLKLNCISFHSKQQETIKIQDFCISKIFRIEQIIQQSLGRAVLSAPQTISNDTSQKSDIWSCGVILYMLLCGQPPIIASTKAKLIHKFKSFFLRFKHKRFKNVSEDGKEMIRKMMRINSNDRPSAEEVMESSWFHKYMKLPKLPENSLRRCFKELYFYKPNSKLQEATWTFFVNALISFQEKQLIMNIFMKIDQGSKGELDDLDIQEGFYELLKDRAQAAACAEKVMRGLKKIRIYYSQFLTYCANRFFLIREINLRKIFSIFDEDGNGEISINEIKDTLGNSKQIGHEVWLDLMQEADANSDGKISFEQFSDMIQQLNYVNQQPKLQEDNPFNEK